jgi:ketosteroid isomerase-like protein
LGKCSIENAFANVIAKVRSSGAKNLILKAEDVDVRTLGDIALVTFHIFDSQTSRRTLIIKRGEEGWRIVHMHASNAPGRVKLGAKL